MKFIRSEAVAWIGSIHSSDEARVHQHRACQLAIDANSNLASIVPFDFLGIQRKCRWTTLYIWAEDARKTWIQPRGWCWNASRVRDTNHFSLARFAPSTQPAFVQAAFHAGEKSARHFSLSFLLSSLLLLLLFVFHPHHFSLLEMLFRALDPQLSWKSFGEVVVVLFFRIYIDNILFLFLREFWMFIRGWKYFFRWRWR